jgi:hypothetical protein
MLKALCLNPSTSQKNKKNPRHKKLLLLGFYRPKHYSGFSGQYHLLTFMLYSHYLLDCPYFSKRATARFYTAEVGRMGQERVG